MPENQRVNMLITDMDLERTRDAILGENLALVKSMLGEVIFAPEETQELWVRVNPVQIRNLMQLHRQYMQQLQRATAARDLKAELERHTPIPAVKKAAAKKAAAKKVNAAKNAVAPKKRGRGRPPGAKNKPKPAPAPAVSDEQAISQALAEAQ